LINKKDQNSYLQEENKMSYFKLSLIAIAIVSLILAACQPQAPTPGTGDGPTQPPTGQNGQQPVTLRFLKINDELEAQAFEEMVQAWHQTEGGRWSHVTIEYDAKPFAELFPAISQSVATGARIDLIQADGPDVKHFAVNRVLWDLTDHFTAEELRTWAPQSIAEGSLGDRFFGPPMVQSCQLMWYNVDMTEAAGLDMSNTAGWTYGDNGTGLPNWEKLTIDADGDGNPEVFGLQIGTGPWDYFQRIAPRTNDVPGSPTFEGIGEDGISFVGYFDSPETIEAYQWVQDTYFRHRIQSVQPPANAFLSGFSATLVFQDLIMGTAQDQFPDFNMGAIEPPYFVTPMCQTGSWHYGIASNTQHFEEALAFVKYASSDEGASFIWKYKSQLPANLNLLNTLPDFQEVPARRLMADFFQQYGMPRIETPAYTEYNALFTEYFQSLMAQDNVEELTQEYALLMEAAAARYRGWNE
jgi:fructooligosaccharide transport system substrate-binding protein